MKCAKWVLVGLIAIAPALHALDVSYGNFLTIKGISCADGKVILPVERKKYYNIRILNKSTYRFVEICKTPCVQEVADIKVAVSEVRPAKECPDMWITSVVFNQDWQATFLVFRREEKYSVKSPVDLIFLQPTLKKRTEEAIISAVKELK